MAPPGRLHGMSVMVFSVIAGLLLLQGFTGERGLFLRVRGDKVLDSSGNPIILRGFNVAFKDFQGLLGEKDIRNISESGANSIRLVLDYRHLESGPFLYNKGSLTLLDSVLDWCEKYRVYVILDMHLAPGIQNPHDFVVHRERSYDFWKKNEFQERFHALWAAIAKRYAGRGIVAGYDLLNEGVPPDTGTYRKVMEKTVEVIRSHDKNHIVFVEEALMPDGRKELVPIRDRNVVYSIHFFYPPQFTFYTTTTERVTVNYPGEMATYGEKIGEARTASVTEDTSWKKIELRTAPPEGAEFLIVTLSSDRNGGTVWFDDVHLERDGTPLDLPAPLVPNNSFEVDYPGISWNLRGRCVAVTEEASRTGKSSIAFSGCMSPSTARGSPIEAKPGEHILTAWVKSENATGDNRLSISWHKRRITAYIDRDALIKRLRYALNFRSLHGVPLHVGEFTAHANPARESVFRYLGDLLGIMRDEGLHWSYWTYYSEYPGIGIHTGNHPRLARPDELDMLRKNM